MGKKVTILGAGNGGVSLAFHMAMNNIDVALWSDPDHSKVLEGIITNGGIEAVESSTKNGVEYTSKISGFAKINLLTTDIKEAIEYSDIIIMVVPSYAQESIFKKAINYLKDNQLVLLLPGNFGSLLLNKLLVDNHINRNILFVEAMSIPYSCRIEAPGKVFISGIKDTITIGSFPGNKINLALKRLQNVMPINLIPQDNVLEVSFNNVNMVVHPGTATLNMGFIESRNGEFFFYKEGISESVSKVLQKIDDERMTIGKQLHLKLSSFLEISKIAYNIEVSSIREFVLKTPVHNSRGYNAPKSAKFRYITEDIPDLLVPVHELAKIAGVEDTTIQSIINIDCIYNDIDYYQEGRTLEKLGLKDKTIDEIINFVNYGNTSKLAIVA